MSTAFFLSELTLAACAAASASAVRPRAPEAALGFVLIAVTAALGGLVGVGVEVLRWPYETLLHASQVWGLPLVAVGWLMVYFGQSGPRPVGRVAIPLVLLALLSWPFGASWRLVGGVGAMLLVGVLATRPHPIQPDVRRGARGAALALLAGLLGTEGALIGVDRVVWFHLLLALACTSLATGLAALPGIGEHRS